MWDGHTGMDACGIDRDGFVWDTPGWVNEGHSRMDPCRTCRNGSVQDKKLDKNSRRPCVDEQGAPGQAQTLKEGLWRVGAGAVAWQEYRQVVQRVVREQDRDKALRELNVARDIKDKKKASSSGMLVMKGTLGKMRALWKERGVWKSRWILHSESFFIPS